MADQIALRIAESQVSAGSAVSVTANFRTRSTGAASTPSSIRYRVDCLTNRQNVINWTSVSAASSVTITVGGTYNAIIDDQNDYETRQLTVEIDTGLSTQVRQAIKWRVNAISNYVPAASFDDDLLLEPYHAITAAETAAGVTPTSFQYVTSPSVPFVNVLRFGADPTGVSDSRAAFVAAMSVGDAFVPYGTYRINGRLPLTQYGIIGEGWGRSGSARVARLVFYNQTDTTLGSVYTDYDSWLGRVIPIRNIQLRASSLDGSTGALGYGVDATASLEIDNVEIAGFGKSGLFLHNTDTDGEAPYNSIIKSVFCNLNGNHGILVGTGANVITFIQPECKWNGTPSYLTAPSVAGNYDGFHIERDNDGNPGSAYFSRLPESITIIGGDCSYNSRYGWNFISCQSGHWLIDYAEGNLQSTPGQVNISNGLRECVGFFNGINGETAGVNFGSVATIANVANSNHFWVGGQDCGVGNSNTATSRYSYALNEHINWVALDSGETNGAAIQKYGTDGRSRLRRAGSTGGFILEPAVYTVATLPSVSDFQAGAVIYVSDETGGAILAFSDGTNWRRVTDRAVVS